MNTAVSIQNLEKTFRRGGKKGVTVAISDLNLDIFDREFFCLLGPSGCGKTTVLNMLAGFDLPTEGAILHYGKEITGPGPDRGVVFQSDDSLFPWLTAYQNVSFGSRVQKLSSEERKKTAEHYLRLVNMFDQCDKYPRELSGGMRQRIQIARVLANEPDILLMDEPFAALDAQTRKKMQVELESIWHKTEKTVFFITHDITEALLLGDRVGVMKVGPRSKVREIIKVDLPRPRERIAPQFMQCYEYINRIIEEEVESKSDF